ncbi:unnamed protein product, partial [marine sediment metagenome]
REMSIQMNIITPNKRPLAELLRAIATMVETSSNKTVTVNMTVTFNPRKEAKDSG